MFLSLQRGVFQQNMFRYRKFQCQIRGIHSSQTEHLGSASSSLMYKARRHSLFTPTLVILGFIPVFTFWLGTWQVGRLKWKVALIDELEEKLQRDPISLPTRINTSVLPEFTYRKVLLRGKWDHAHSILLGPRVRDGETGYHLVTPLTRDGGSTVLVDRGFVSKDFAEASKHSVQDDKEVEVLGMLRTSGARNNFTPDNNPEKGEWFWADVDALVEYAGGERAGVQPVFVEEIFEGHAGDASWQQAHGIPIGRSPKVDLRNAHVSYIVTWYSLSAFTSVMFLRLLLKQRRGRSRLPRT